MEKKIGLFAAAAGLLGSLGTIDGMTKKSYSIKHGKGHNAKGKKNTYSQSIQFSDNERLPDGRHVWFKRNGEMIRRSM